MIDGEACCCAAAPDTPRQHCDAEVARNERSFDLQSQIDLPWIARCFNGCHCRPLKPHIEICVNDIERFVMKFSERLKAFRTKRGWSQAEMGQRLRVSGSYIYQLESERREPGEPLQQVFEMLEEAEQRTVSEEPADYGIERRKGPAPTKKAAIGQMRMIPVVSMARAGMMTDFEELPIDWQSQIPSDCPDSGAFGIELRGDSMEPRFQNGDIVIVMPHMEPRYHSFVVARLADGGAVFKLFNADPSQEPPVVRLTSLNPQYEPIVVTGEQLVRCYPVYGVFRKLW